MKNKLDGVSKALGSPRTAEVAVVPPGKVTHGINGVVGGGAASTLLANFVVEVWRDALAKHGDRRSSVATWSLGCPSNRRHGGGGLPGSASAA
jgi:hypothetical protein